LFNPTLFDPTPPPEISIVVPLYNEEENVRELHRRVTAAMEALGLSYELVLVNDGSRDSTPKLIQQLQAADARVAPVYLSRNFGHQAAVCAGIDATRGRAVFVIDGDLQDPPEVFDRFIERWRAGYEVVYAVRRKRKENVLKRIGYFVFYRLLRVVSDLEIPLDSGDFCLMDRRVVDVLKHLPERMRFVRGLRSFVGFRQTGVDYERNAREAGEPKYSFRALFGLAVDGLISFSSFPLTLIAYLGFFTAGSAFLLMLWSVFDVGSILSTHIAPAVVIAAVLFVGSLQLFAQAILGEYIRRIFVECKGRPTYIRRDSPGAAIDEQERKKAA
jgi:dolichol-phosphate mannosyltransferase